MKKRKGKVKPFVAGFLTAGAAVALYSAIFPFFRIGDYIIGLAVAALLGWIVYTMAQGLDTSKPAPSQQPIPQTGDVAVDSLVKRGQEMLAEIRTENDRIPDEALSKKIDRLEDVANRIFRTVAEQPKKAPQIRRFMDYYLPTTLKMLTGYRRIGERQVTGDNAQKTRQQIEEAMDVVLKAFDRQLDTMYQDDMLDVSTDIDVLETMLRQDGLIDSGLNAAKKQAQEEKTASAAPEYTASLGAAAAAKAPDREKE